MMPIKLCPYELSDKIEILREEMVMIGLNEGFCSQKTIEASQKLDQYIAIYISIDFHLNELNGI
ncbi:aspartyl-phosphate phosphatase Spo0E family protein [Bacillus sp. EB106-08-02-XG196]|uniref:aspartyl-phosphate phosphatase Spo0E family protein n=1 Tax=Bacillus sp. EB106-08-02-XG196 TaxID=2737049 RepID=UPI0015C4BCFC|nr:aspartyl-phosphate phosphatase Spo0E family protein [Bacillus sp. EB106-08-02-XG196]NWQ42696.1 aspartyl-phosphate phosphatase Spo0E family protein [Bacillus sp. EB106-08-02-XG196]